MRAPTGRHHPDRIRRLLCFAVLMPLLLSACDGADAQPERQPVPTLMDAGAISPPPTPPEDRKLLVIELNTDSSPDGKHLTTSLDSAQILRSYAPNVFGRPGEWTVRLRAESAGQCGDPGTNCFGIADPRLVEIESPEAEQPFQYVFEPTVTWQLTVPLYRDGEALDVTAIDVLDENGELIISLDYDADIGNVSVAAASTATLSPSPTPVPTFTPEETATRAPTATSTTTATSTPSPTATPITSTRQLVDYEPIDGVILPDLAIDWGIANDGLQLRMLLAEVTLPNGRPLLASFVVNRLQQELDPRQYGVEALEVLDDRAFAVIFTQRGAAEAFLFALTEIDFEVVDLEPS